MELLIKGMISKFWGRFLVIKHEMEEKYAVKSYFSENFYGAQNEMYHSGMKWKHA